MARGTCSLAEQQPTNTSTQHKAQRRHAARIQAFANMKKEILHDMRQLVALEVRTCFAHLLRNGHDDTTCTELPTKVASDTPVIACAVAAQLHLSTTFKVSCHNPGTAYAVVRPHAKSSWSEDMLSIQPEANARKHLPIKKQVRLEKDPCQVVHTLHQCLASPDVKSEANTDQSLADPLSSLPACVATFADDCHSTSGGSDGDKMRVREHENKSGMQTATNPAAFLPADFSATSDSIALELRAACCRVDVAGRIFNRNGPRSHWDMKKHLRKSALVPNCG